MGQRAQYSVEPLAWEAGPGRNREPRQLEHGSRLLPREEVGELVGADHEQRVVEALCAQQVDRARIWIEPHLVVRERSAGELEPRFRGALHILVTWALGHEHNEAQRIEVRLCRACNGHMSDVRRVERAAEEPRHWNSRTSSPTSTASPRRTPAARSASSSSGPGGGRPTTR